MHGLGPRANFFCKFQKAKSQKLIQKFQLDQRRHSTKRKKTNYYKSFMSIFVFLWSNVLQGFATADANMHLKEFTLWKYTVSNTCQLERKYL